MMKPEQPLTTPGPAVEQPSIATTWFGLPVRYSKKRLALAFAIAAISDAVGAFVMLAPPAMWAVDIVTVVLLFAVLGWQWLLLPGMVLESIPGVGGATVLAAGRGGDCHLGNGAAEVEMVQKSWGMNYFPVVA